MQNVGSQNSSALHTLARVGYAAKGVVYLIIGGLAAQGVAQAGSQGALTKIAQQPFGRVLLAVVALGLAAYALWRLVQGFADSGDEGGDASGIGKRIGYVGSGLAYAALTVAAVQIILGGGGSSGGGSGGGAQDWTATLLQAPFGRFLVGAVGVGVVLGGLYQLYQAVSAKFTEEFRTGEMSSTELTWARRVGRVGHAARSVVYFIIGWFLLRAALTSNASEVGGLGKALDTLQGQPYGAWLLGVTGVGLAAYGVYCFVLARYRRETA
ncbi:DUF1206 domain-containing protein [soil metagenome]